MEKRDFITLLEEHDWTYEYSEDTRSYRAGSKERTTIYTAILQRRIEGKEDFQQIYDIYNPFNMSR